MKRLTLEISYDDFVSEFDVKISNKFAASIQRAFKSFCEDYDYEYEDCLDDSDTWEEFFCAVDLDEISEKDAHRVFDAVSIEAAKELNSEDTTQKNWDYRPVRISDDTIDE